MRIPIKIKLAGLYLAFVLLIFIMAYNVFQANKKNYIQEEGKNSLIIGEEIFKRMDQRLFFLYGQLRTHSNIPALRERVSRSNILFAGYPDPKKFIKYMDQQWISAPKTVVTPFMRDIIENDTAEYLREIFIRSPSHIYGYSIIQEIIVTNKFGANVAVSAKTQDFDQSDENWWQQTHRQGVFVDEIQYDYSLGKYGMDLAISINDENERFIGAILVNLDVKNLIREAEVTNRKHDTTKIRIVTDDGRLIYSTTPYRFMTDVRNETFFQQMLTERNFFIDNNPNSELFSFIHSKGFKFFKGSGWTMIISQRLEDVLKPYWRLQRRFLIVVLFIVFVGILMIYLLGRIITSHLKSFAIAIEAIGKGDLSKRAKIRSNDELGDLVSAFNQMVDGREQVENSLRESESRYRELFENMKSGVAVYDAIDNGRDFIFKDLNLAGTKSTHVRKKDALGKRVTECFPGIKEFGLLTVFQKVWRSAKPIHHPVAMYEDERLSAYFENYVYKLGSGEIVAIFNDMTEIKKVQESLHRSENLLNEVGRIARIGGWEVDLKNSKVNWTRAAYDICEIETNEAIPKLDEIIVFFLPKYRTMIEEKIRKLINEDNTLDFEAELKSTDGKIRWCKVMGNAVRENGLCVKVYGTIQDITKQKSIEQELEEHRFHLESLISERTLQLRNANKELEAFTYSVSHDLKAPLRAIIGFSEIITSRHRQDLNKEGKHYSDNIIKASKQMDRLIDDLLRYSRLGRRSITIRPVALNEALQNTLDLLDEKIRETDAAISIADDMPVVLANETLLQQVFVNLLTNSLLYHAPDVIPQIDINASEKEDFIQISVADNGLGIPAGQQEKIFHVFQRLHAQKEFPGTGIGLAIVKKAVSIMEGQVWVESNIGKGSIFYVKLKKYAHSM